MKPLQRIPNWLGVLFLGISIGLTCTAATGEDLLAKSGRESIDEGEANYSYIKGRQLVFDGKYEESVPYLEKALQGDPENSLMNHQLSEVYLRLGNFEKSEIFGKKAVEKDPKNEEYRITLAGVEASLRKYPEAKEQYQKILENDPSNARVPLLLGILEAESGQVEKGIDVLSKFISDSPENYMGYFYRARMYLETEQIEKARADLDKSLSLRPQFVEAGTALGLIYERLNNNEEAIKTYKRIQGTGAFKKRLAQLYLQNNQFKEALQELVEYEKSEPDDYTARVKVGLIYFELKQFDKAQKEFETILKEQSDADNVRFYLGWVQEEQKNYSAALQNFKKVTKDSNLFKEAMLHTGYILKEQKKYAEGASFAKGLVAKNPEVEEFYDLQITFVEGKGDKKKALELATEGVKKFPTSEKMIYVQGALLDKNGNKKGAIENMRKIVAMNPKNYHALNFIGYTFAELGENLEEAEGLIRKAIALKPNDGYIQDSLGWVLFKQGKVDDALKELEQAAALTPEESVVLEHIGDVYTHKKEFAKAKEFYKKAVSYAKSDKESLKKLEGKIAGLPKTDEKRVPTAENH